MLLLFMALLATVIGLLLAYSNRKLKLGKDGALEERHQALLEAMPGINCGACGFPSCDGYAVALNSGQTDDLTLCPPGGNEVAVALGQILGKEPGEVPAEVAFVKCQGSPEYAKYNFHYQGLQDCQAAAQLYKGGKSCEYGCIGLGSCIQQCPTDAISINKNSLAVVEPELCIGCRKCIPVCPTKVIEMIPKAAEYAVICNALDHGKVTRSNCKVGCIGCRVCERKYPELQFKVRQNLASVDYQALGMYPSQGTQPMLGSHSSQGSQQSQVSQPFAPDFAKVAETIKKCPSSCIVPLGGGCQKVAQMAQALEQASQTDSKASSRS